MPGPGPLDRSPFAPDSLFDSIWDLKARMTRAQYNFIIIGVSKAFWIAQFRFTMLHYEIEPC